MSRRFCFVTEADLDRRGVGGVVTDLQLLRCLRELGEVDTIYLQRIRLRSTPLALLVLGFQILRSFTESYSIYFSRGLLTSFLLVLLNKLTFRRRKVVYRALSVPLGSKEVPFLRFGRVESFVRFAAFQFLERVLFPKLDMLTVAAEEYGDVLAKLGVEKERIHVLPFFVEDAFFNQPIKETASEPFVFGYAGGFHFYHDMMPLIEAFQLLSKGCKDSQLVLVGDGLSRPKVEREVNERDLSGKVKFVGRIAYASMPETLAGMDCFLLLTHAPGMPIGLLEAAATGKPMITVRKKADVALNRLFEHRKAIFMVNSPTSEEIVEAMRLLREDDGLRNSLAIGAREVAKRHFSKETARKQLRLLVDRFV
jgi:glycosyltransferase involved in cell wall biosynthesis